MDAKLNLVSAIYRISPNSDNGIMRDNRVAIAIEMSVDRVFMAMYCRRSVHSKKSVAHIRQSLLSSNLLIAGVLKGVLLNPAENSVIEDLSDLCSMILNGQIITRYISSVDMIESFVSRVAHTSNTITEVIKSIRLVLAMANQINYVDNMMVVPCIRIVPGDVPYAKCFTTHNLMFNHDMRVSGSDPNMLWYNIFNGMRLSTYAEGKDQEFIYLCSTINIGTIPDAATGLGITNFTYEAYVGSDLTRKFINQTKALINDQGLVTSRLLGNNPWMKTSDILIQTVGSLEADFTDSVSQDDSTTDNGGVTKESTDTETTNDGTATADAEVAPDNSDPGDTTIDASTPDNSADASDPNNLDNPSETDGSDNTDERKPLLVGLDLTLPKKETLDSFMYKISVARFIDTVIEFNHDELPLETVTTLTKWKSTLLFLTDAGETERLLKELKITLK